MSKTKPVRKPAQKIYTIVRGVVETPVDLGPLGIAPCTAGPYEILADGLVDPAAARARCREFEEELNPAGAVGGAAVFWTTRGQDYKPKPERYSEYSIRAYYSRRMEPLEVELKDVRRRPSAVKSFRDYVGRIRTREAGDGPTARRVYGRLSRAELVRHDYYRGKPAGLEVVLTDAELRP